MLFINTNEKITVINKSTDANYKMKIVLVDMFIFKIIQKVCALFPRKKQSKFNFKKTMVIKRLKDMKLLWKVAKKQK